MSRVLKSRETSVTAIKVIQLTNVSFDQTFDESIGVDPTVSSVTGDLISELSLQDKYEQLLHEFESYKRSVLDQQQLMQKTFRDEVESEKERAKQEGYTIGYHEGLQRGFEEGMQQFSRQIQEAERILQTVKDERVQYLEQNESIMIEVATHIAGKILQRQVDVNPDSILPVVRAAIQEVRDIQQVEIRVHPCDYQTVFQEKQTLITSLPGQSEFLLIPDSAVTQGGCVIHTAFGSVDARIDSQLNEIKRVLLDASRGTDL